MSLVLINIIWHLRKLNILFPAGMAHSGHIERRYVEVPSGANWVEVTMRVSNFDTARRFFVDAVQVLHSLSFEHPLGF